jgi:hypothetical protein
MDETTAYLPSRLTAISPSKIRLSQLSYSGVRLKRAKVELSVYLLALWVLTYFGRPFE